MPSEPLIVMDFETTGLSPFASRVTEVAALKVLHGRVVDRFVSLINCGVMIPAQIVAFTGITNEMVASAPWASEVMPSLRDFVEGCPVVAHNGHFDQGFYERELQRLGLRSASGDFVCTVRLARRLVPGLNTYRLAALSEHCGVRFLGRAHRALADAEVTSGVLVHLIEQVRLVGIETVTAALLRKIMSCRIADAGRVLAGARQSA
jgi:DNA polymerase III subunit epsilon